MIIDAHCHAWERWPYVPVTPDPFSRARAERLLWEMDQHGVASAVLIAASIGENQTNADYTGAAAKHFPGRFFSFPDADCRWSPFHHSDGAARRLEALVAAHDPAGINHYMNEKADPAWLVSDEGVAFFAVAARENLIVSISCGPSQMPTVSALAQRFPHVPFLLHHLGWIPASPAPDREAAALVLAAARQPNIHVKFSGFGYAMSEGWNFPCASALEVARMIYDAYGPDRLIWGSDYPVSQRYMTYRQSLEIVRTHCSFISGPEMRNVLGDNMHRLLKARTNRVVHGENV